MCCQNRLSLNVEAFSVLAFLDRRDSVSLKAHIYFLLPSWPTARLELKGELASELLPCQHPGAELTFSTQWLAFSHNPVLPFCVCVVNRLQPAAVMSQIKKENGLASQKLWLWARAGRQSVSSRVSRIMQGKQDAQQHTCSQKQPMKLSYV